jgi:hypothetical protein
MSEKMLSVIGLSIVVTIFGLEYYFLSYFATLWGLV